MELLLPSDVVIRYLHWPRIEVCYPIFYPIGSNFLVIMATQSVKVTDTASAKHSQSFLTKI